MNNGKRIKLQIPSSTFEKRLNIFTILFLVLTVIYILWSWRSLPDVVPIHFDFTGEADSWGSKWLLLPLPILSLIIFIGMSILERYPHAFNYLVEITEDNVEKQYKNGKLMMNVIKNETVLLLSLISLDIIVNAINGVDFINM